MASMILKQKSCRQKGDDERVGNVKVDMLFSGITHTHYNVVDHGFDWRLTLTLTSNHYTSSSGAQLELALITQITTYFSVKYTEQNIDTPI